MRRIQEASAPMPRLPSASAAAASRFAAFWAADALAADDSLDFSVTTALVGVSPDSLKGAPEAVRERVAMRCLRELVSAASSEGEVEAAAAKEGVVLGVDASGSCEDLLLRLIREVGSSGSLEKDMISPFKQDIQRFICIKRPTLPETSFELLRQVYPEITPVVPPSPMKQNGNDQHENISHDLVNTEKIGFATDGAQLQQDDLANLVNESNTQNLQKDTMPTPDFHQPCASDNRCFDQPQEDYIDTVGVSIKSPDDYPTNVDRHMPVATEPSLSRAADLLGSSNSGTMSERDMIDHTTIVQSQSCGVRNPHTLHNNNGDRPLVASIQSPKGSIHEGSTMHATVSPAFDRSNDALPASTSETSHLPEFVTAQDTVMTSEQHISKTRPNSQIDTGERANQDADLCGAGIQTAAALLSEGFNGAIQGDRFEIKDPPENTREHMEMFEQENSDKAHLEVGCSDKVDEALCDGNIMKNNMVCGGPNVQTAPESHSSCMALHNKNSEANHLSEQNIGGNTTDIQRDCCSIPASPQDVNGKQAKQASNKGTMGNTVAETLHVHPSGGSFCGVAAAGLLSMTDKVPFCTQDQDANCNVEGFSEQDLCIVCGKDGQLLKCCSCLLAAHDTCFGSSVTFDDSGQFYCPVCFYTKATEAYQKAKKTYCEARKNLSTFLGRKKLGEQEAAVQRGAANSEYHFNGCNTSKRQGNHHSGLDNLSHRDEEPDRQRKKQKTNAKSDACTQEVVTEKAPVIQKSDVASMNKHPELQNNRKQAQDEEHEQPEEIAEVHGESGNDGSLHKTRHSAQNKCSPTNQNVDTGREDGIASPHQSEESDEIEASSSDDSRKQSSPPWLKLRHHKARCQDKNTAIPSTSKKALGHHDQHMASPSRKRNYAYPPKRYSNPVAPAGRRTKLHWTEQEEATLREAMAKFTPSDNGPIPWIKIQEYGRDVFHRTRLPSDLRVKWRNMKKKSDS